MTDTPILRTLSAAVGATDPAPDAELLRRYAGAGDGTAFELLVRRHAAMVWAVCRAALPRDRHAAEDAFQAAFLALARKAGAVRGASAAGWLFRVARNAAGRAARRRAAAPLPDGLPAPEAPPADLREAVPIVAEEVDRLAAKFRDPVVLCFYQGHTHAEAADRLGWPVGTVASRLARAKAVLRGRLTRRGVALPAGGIAAVLAAPADAPAALVRAAVTTTLGPAGRIPPGVLSLTVGVLTAMRLAHLRTFALAATAALGLVALAAASLDAGPGTTPGHRPAGVPGRAPADDKEAAAELKAIEGRWRVVKLEEGSEELPAEKLAKVRFTFKGDQLEQTEAGAQRIESFKVALSPRSNPKRLDLTPLDREPKNRVIPVIYKRDGDTLTICGPSTEQKDLKRPTEFKPADGVVLLTLERVKGEKEELAALAGKWKVTALRLSGKAAAADELATMSWTISPTGEVVADDGTGQPPEKMTLTVNPAAAPAHVGMTLVGGPENLGEIAGIYFRQADKLVIAFADPKKKSARPTELKPGDEVAYIALERVRE